MRCRIVSRSSVAAGISGNESWTGRVVDAVTVKAMSPALETLPISSAADRPTGVSDIWRNAERRFSAVRGISTCRNRSPGASTLLWLPMTKSATLIFRSLPSAFQIVQTPSSAAVSAIFGRAGQRVKLRDCAGRGDRQPGVADRERGPSEIGEIDQPRQVDLGFREQPGAAREPSIACRPNGQLSPRLRVRDFDDGVQIHEYTRAINEILLPAEVLQNRRQLSSNDCVGL